MIAEDSLKVLVDQVRPWLGLGEVSTYLPELSRARSDELAVAIGFGGNGVISAGDHAATFRLQSVVTVFTLLLALHHHGKEYVFERVGFDQAPGSYNSLETFKHMRRTVVRTASGQHVHGSHLRLVLWFGPR